MTRDFSDELLSAYLDGQLPDDQRAAVEAHLAAHPADRQLLDELRSLRGRVKSLPAHRADSGFADRVVQAALAAKATQNGAVVVPRPAGVSSRRIWTAAVLAGVSAVAAALAIMVWQPGRSAAPAVSPLDAALANLKQSLPAEEEAIVLRIRVPAGVPAGQAIDLALASAGIGQRSAADGTTGANEVGAAYRKQLADKFGGQQPGVPNPALTAATESAEEAVFVEASWDRLELAVKELAVAAEAPLDISPLAKVAAARPNLAAGRVGEGEGEGASATGQIQAAPSAFAQKLNPRMFRLEKSPGSAVLPATGSAPVDPARPVRVLLLIESAEK